MLYWSGKLLVKTEPMYLVCTTIDKWSIYFSIVRAQILWIEVFCLFVQQLSAISEFWHRSMHKTERWDELFYCATENQNVVDSGSCWCWWNSDAISVRCSFWWRILNLKWWLFSSHRCCPTCYFQHVAFLFKLCKVLLSPENSHSNDIWGKLGSVTYMDHTISIISIIPRFQLLDTKK